MLLTITIAASALLSAAFLKPQQCAVVLGILLPIDVLGSVNPVVLDIIRYGLAGVLVFRTQARPGNAPLRLSNYVVACLIIVALAPALRSAYLEGTLSASSSLVGAASVLVGLMIAKRPTLIPYLLSGFVLGSSFSALDIVAQFLGLPYLGLPTQLGWRYPGLSFSSTNTAPFLACAIVLLLRPIGSAHRHLRHPPLLTDFYRATTLRAALALVLTVGLVLSGGRGGIGGLSLAVFLLIFLGYLKRPAITPFIMAAFVGLSVTQIDRILGYLNREGGRTQGFSSGRYELNGQAWRAITESPLWGVPPPLSENLRPHTPILSFGVSAGILGLLIGVALVAVVARVALCPTRNPRPATTSARLVCCVILVTSLLEPVGFFVGFTKAVILIAVISVWESTTLQAPSSSRNRNDQYAANATSASDDTANSEPLPRSFD